MVALATGTTGWSARSVVVAQEGKGQVVIDSFDSRRGRHLELRVVLVLFRNR
jgi:hypothetical protein